MEELSIPELEFRYIEAKNEWENFKQEEIEKYNQKLLDLYPYEIVGDSDIDKKRRKKAIKNIKFAQYRQYSFNRLSKGVGKGEKKSLK